MTEEMLAVLAEFVPLILAVFGFSVFMALTEFVVAFFFRPGG